MSDIVDGMFQDGLLDWYADEDEEAEFGGRQASQGVKCRYCGKTGLWWLPQRRGSYRLMNPNGDFHVCHRPCTADEFEVLDAPTK